MNTTYVRWFEELGRRDVPIVGGKNASLGEMIQHLGSAGIRVPGGFATTADAYRAFLDENDLRAPIADAMGRLERGAASLDATGRAVRSMIERGRFPAAVADSIRTAYRALCERRGAASVPVAVRSSATAEDLPEASFAGQQESFLNVMGEDEVIDACRRCYASLFTDRAITYRHERGFSHLDVALSVGVQLMVRSDMGSAGVMFSIDTDTGFPHMVVINAAWGLGESVVQGTVDPDELLVFKPRLGEPGLSPIVQRSLGSKQTMIVHGEDGRRTRQVATPAERRVRYALGNDDALALARWAVLIEQHYGQAMDMEWAKDGTTGELFIVQARPETVQSRREATSLKSYRLLERGTELATGLAIGDAIAAGKACVIRSVSDIDRFRDGAVLVTEMTDPDWVPIMKRAAAIVTDHGGRTSHAAIVSRELGVPAVVGTGTATRTIRDDQPLTVSCAEGEHGHIYDGTLGFEVSDIDLSSLPQPPVRIMMNIADPDAALRWWRLPARGIGLARMEFIISNVIKVHPLALTRYDTLEDADARRRIDELTAGYDDRTEYFVDTLAQGLAVIAASQYPEPVIVRLSDFKTNEYASLIGGRQFEPHEENPMIGFRGASRYYSDRYRDGFALECRAILRARMSMGLGNLVVMVPFVRSVTEADRVLAVLAENGLERGRDGLEVYMMCEVPSNVILATEFAKRFDGFSIGSNDLTQLILGVDRDAGDLAPLFDERNPAVLRAIASVITEAHRAGCKVGICGQAPSDYPEFAAFLVECGIDSISLNPDSVVPIIRRLASP